jgi:hypothetical protein
MTSPFDNVKILTARITELESVIAEMFKRAPLIVTVDLTASGTLGTEAGQADTGITVGLTADGTVSPSANMTVGVELAAAGALGVVGQANTAIGVGLTAVAANVASGQAPLNVAAALTADGIVPPIDGGSSSTTATLVIDGGSASTTASLVIDGGTS